MKRFSHSKQQLYFLLVENEWSSEDLEMEIDSIGVADVQAFVDNVLFSNETAIEALVFGKCNCHASSNYVEILRRGFGNFQVSLVPQITASFICVQ